MLTPEQIEMIGRCGFEDISYAKRWDATDQSIQNLIAAIRLAALDEAIAFLNADDLFEDDGVEYNQGIRDATAVLMNLREKR